MKFCAIFLISLAAGVALAQDTTADSQTRTTPLTLASGLLEHDFVNFYLFGNGIYDTETASGSPNVTSLGEEVGGGISASHLFRDGSLSLSYRGAYRNYSNSTFSSGTDQNLSFGISKQLTKRWGISFYQAAGIYLYGGTYFSVEPVGSNFVETNPFSPETKFLSSGLSVTYQQTRRLSYSFSGDFFLNRYNYGGAIGTTGTAGTATMQYRVTRRTTVGGGYSRSYYVFQHSAGSLQADSYFLTLSHQFSNRWNASVSAGATRTNNVGSILIPVSFITNGQITTGYVTGHYNVTTTFPSFSGSVTHNFHRTSLSVNAGEGLSPGNGFLISSRSFYVNGFYSYSMRGSSLGFGGTYTRYTSIANSVSSAFTTVSFVASYSRVLTRYFGVNVNYSLINYPQFGGRSDNRITFGAFFSSKSIPITLF
ncbi:MAG: hypothetical protein JOZ48_03680 [Acidobacteriaceae bacterium]|nr:hypothetical protein [Acidobacteriaceae bacterium]